MTKPDISDHLQPLIQRCKPLRITVKLRTVKDKYYIDFDGSLTYTVIHEWNVYWVSFESYVTSLLKDTGFKHDSITKKDDSHCSAFIGTLFDFLTKTHD